MGEVVLQLCWETQLKFHFGMAKGQDEEDLTIKEGEAAQSSSPRSLLATPKIHLKTVAMAVKPWWSLDKMGKGQDNGPLLDTHSLTLLDKVYAGSPRASGQSALDESFRKRSPRGPMTYEEKVAADERREMKREQIEGR